MPDAMATLYITVKVEEAGEITNVVQVTAADQPDVDSTPNNNEPDEDDQDEVTIVGEQIDLSLNKSASPTTVALGDDFVYTITVTNDGPSDATGVQVNDDLP